MNKLLLIAALASVTPLVTGCSLFSKKARAKESSAIAGEVEATFRQRWIDQRVGQLAAQGVAADAARAQAGREFDERYQFGLKDRK
jgi:outer membrane murein-binding lipoprotein Lpp